jgi:hypothetical protein
MLPDSAAASTLHGLGLLTLLALAPLAMGPLPEDEDPLCPYCAHDPALMEASGIVSHGGFEFGTGDTASIELMLGTAEIVWIETPHFKIGMGLSSHKLKGDERKKVRAELERLAEALPEVQPRANLLDPWLRAHLYAQRTEDLWDRFLEIVQVDEDEFPEAGEIWNTQGKYMGQGPYLGQASKFELLMLPSEAASQRYLTESFGLPIRLTQRWHDMARGSLSTTLHTQQDGLRDDQALHGHVVFNLSVSLLDGFRHYSYDLPTWIREGLAHHLERELNPAFNTFDSSEGAQANTTRKSNWEAETRKLVKAGTAPRMAELMGLRDFSSLELRHHYATWSVVDWLLRTNPGGFACYLNEISGLLNEAYEPDGSNLSDAHRRIVQECLNLRYVELDAAWRAWVEATYPGR